MKVNTMKEKDPTSERSKRRKKRNFQGSRPNRRAKRRADQNDYWYRNAMATAVNKSGITKAGTNKQHS